MIKKIQEENLIYGFKKRDWDEVESYNVILELTKKINELIDIINKPKRNKKCK